MNYPKGWPVRSRGGYPALALGIERFCLRKTKSGVLLLDTIRHLDASILPESVPTQNELDDFLKRHEKAYGTAQAGPGATIDRKRSLTPPSRPQRPQSPEIGLPKEGIRYPGKEQ